MRQSCNFTNISQWIAHSKHCFCHFECFLMRTFSKAKGFSLHKPCFPSVIPCIPFNRVYQRILPPLLLQIYGASTASYGKKVSSTYLRYACGTFLPIFSSICKRLFSTAMDGGGFKQQQVLFDKTCHQRWYKEVLPLMRLLLCVVPTFG